MKVILLKNLNSTGVITERCRVIPDYFEFEFEEPGKLRIGDKTYVVDGRKIFVSQYDIMLGKHMKLVFVDKNGREYDCGEIHRTGSRLVEFHNDIEHSLVDACAALDEARCEIAELKDSIKQIKEQMGINLIGG